MTKHRSFQMGCDASQRRLCVRQDKSFDIVGRLEYVVCTLTCITAVLSDTEILTETHWGIACVTEVCIARLSAPGERRSDCCGSSHAATAAALV